MTETRWPRQVEVGLIRALAVALGVTVASGVALAFHYLPDIGESAQRAMLWIQLAHVLSAITVVLAALALLIPIAWERRRGFVWTFLGVVGLVATVAVAWVSGRALPWNAVALRSVRIGEQMRGISVAWNDQAEGVIVRGDRIDVHVYRSQVVAHLALGGAAVVLCTLVFHRVVGPRLPDEADIGSRLEK